MLDRTALTPLWAQVREDLRARLSAGEFANGVPPEVALAMEYGVSRHTMREALSALRAEGVVMSQRGRGTTVVQAVTQPALWPGRATTRLLRPVALYRDLEADLR